MRKTARETARERMGSWRGALLLGMGCPGLVAVMAETEGAAEFWLSKLAGAALLWAAWRLRQKWVDEGKMADVEDKEL